MIDYRKILKEYMKHVVKSEGVHMLEGETGIDNLSPEEFGHLLDTCELAGDEYSVLKPHHWTIVGNR